MQDLGTLSLDLFSVKDFTLSLLPPAPGDGFRGRFISVASLSPSYVTSLGLYFPVCKMGIIYTSQGGLESEEAGTGWYIEMGQDNGETPLRPWQKGKKS